MAKLKTSTKISVNITDSGLKLFIHSPEIGASLESFSFLEYFWKNQKEVDDGSFPFNSMVRYFATPEKYRTPENVKDFFSSDCYTRLFNILRRGARPDSPIAKQSISIDSRDWLFNKDAINIFALTDPEIKNGKSFSYSGVFSVKTINDHILPVFREYAEAYIKKFVAGN